jgi:cation transport ATPase
VNDQIDPADAARALREIDRRREQVIRRKVFPGWWWWAYAVLMIAFSAAVESGRGVVPWIGIALFVVGSLLIDVPVRRAARAAAPRRGLGARRTLIGLGSFVALVLGVGMATGLSLKAAGVPYPGMIAAAVAGVLFAVVGPMLVRWEADMLVRQSRSQG